MFETIWSKKECVNRDNQEALNMIAQIIILLSEHMTQLKRRQKHSKAINV